MKILKEAFINKDTIKNVSFNKYNVTKKDLIGEIKNIPLEIIVLALEEQEKQQGKIDIRILQNKGILGAFTWSETEQGHKFWDEIDSGNYDKFYKKYSNHKK